MQHRHPNSPIVQLLARCSAMSVAALCAAQGADPATMEQMLLDMERMQRIEFLRPIGLGEEIGAATCPEAIFVRLVRPSDEDYLWELREREWEHSEDQKLHHTHPPREAPIPVNWRDYHLLPWATA